MLSALSVVVLVVLLLPLIHTFKHGSCLHGFLSEPKRNNKQMIHKYFCLWSKFEYIYFFMGGKPSTHTQIIPLIAFRFTYILYIFYHILLCVLLRNKGTITNRFVKRNSSERFLFIFFGCQQSGGKEFGPIYLASRD